MNWIVFSYSLPAKRASSARVSLWRRLQRLGAVTPKAGVYVLPVQDDCVEAFQWLAQEVQEMGGDAVVMRVDRFEGLPDAKLMELFQQACRDRYAEIEMEALRLEKRLRAGGTSTNRAEGLGKLEKLRKRHEELAETDFFNAPEGAKVGTLLRTLDERLRPGDAGSTSVAPMSIADYRHARWVTRPRPHVDRLACAWLVRRFINPAAVIRYSTRPDPDEVRFDMRGAEFSHEGLLCTFESMVHRFGLGNPALDALGEIVHEVDLRDGLYAHQETAGLDAILRGWLVDKLSDEALDRHGIVLFQGLYQHLSRRYRESSGK